MLLYWKLLIFENSEGKLLLQYVKLKNNFKGPNTQRGEYYITRKFSSELPKHTYLKVLRASVSLLVK